MFKKLIKDFRTWVFVLIFGAVAYAAVPEFSPVTIESITDAIISEQDKYFAKNGIYFQGLPHKTSKKPFYQTDGWPEFVNLKNDLPFEVTVNQYVAPDGPGYQIIFEETGTTTSVGFGPEADSRTFIRINPDTTSTYDPNATST